MSAVFAGGQAYILLGDLASQTLKLETTALKARLLWNLWLGSAPQVPLIIWRRRTETGVHRILYLFIFFLVRWQWQGELELLAARVGFPMSSVTLDLSCLCPVAVATETSWSRCGGVQALPQLHGPHAGLCFSCASLEHCSISSLLEQAKRVLLFITEGLKSRFSKLQTLLISSFHCVATWSCHLLRHQILALSLMSHLFSIFLSSDITGLSTYALSPHGLEWPFKK